MSLETLRKSLKEKSEAVTNLAQKFALDNSTAEDRTALEAATADLEGVQKKYDLLETAEKAAAGAAKPVSDPVGAKKFAQVKQHQIDDEPIFITGVAMAGMAAVKSGQFPNLREALDESGFTQIADRLEGMSGKQLQSSVPTGAGLVLPTMAADIIEFLRPQTAFIQNNPRRVPLENGTHFQAGANTGAVASYGKENSVPAYSEATFRDINLFSKELMGKTAISNKLLKRGVTQIRQFVEYDLRSAMSETMDLNMFLGDGAQNRPLGIYNVPGINARAAVDSLTPTVAQIDGDARWAVNSLMNVPRVGWAWTMSQETIGYLEDLRDGNGNPIYPSMQGDNKTFKGFPVTQTTNLPTNLGVGGNRSHVSLIAWPHVFFGEEDAIGLRASSEATYTDAAGNLRSCFERDETLMITTASHDAGVRHLRAVAILTDVRWGR